MYTGGDVDIGASSESERPLPPATGAPAGYGAQRVAAMMKRRLLGRTGLEITSLGYGAMEIRGEQHYELRTTTWRRTYGWQSLVLLTLALACCTSQPIIWTKPGFDMATFRQDDYACFKEANETRWGSVHVLYRQCMGVKGYSVKE